MKSRLSLVLRTVVILLCLAQGRAQAQAQGFQALYSRDGIDVWAVGDGGVVFRSFDGGNSWTDRTLGQKTLRGVVARNLTVIVAGDSGKVWRSTDSGGSWSLTVLSGAPDLRGISMPTDAIGYIVGAGGVIFKTTDGGASWASKTSGTAATLHSVYFADGLNGWAVGDNGTVLKTTNGGTNWSPVTLGTTRSLRAVDLHGSTIWIVGFDGAAYKSTNAGSNFAPINLKLDPRADVMTVRVVSPDTVYIAGGGGFIRRSYDGGATWTFLQHAMQAQISSLFFVAEKGWAASNKNRTVLFTPDRGQSWGLPGGTGVTRSWSRKLPSTAPIRGNTFAQNATYKSTIYCALGDSVFRSRDEGETWSLFSIIPGCTKINAFIVSPKDSNQMVAAVAGGPNGQIQWTVNGGQSWNIGTDHDFGEYGIPLEMDPDHPDTLYFGPESNTLYRSFDFGHTWASWSSGNFRSPCDIVVVPDSSNIILVGDGITGSNDPPGQILKSTDGGQNFTLKETRPATAYEIPGLACSRLRNSTVFSTNWATGGVQRSTDFGDSWPGIASTGAAWGVDISRDDPNCMIYGVYTGGVSYLSLDGGTNFTAITLPASNYGFYARDRGLILALQSDGVYKLSVEYDYATDNTQALSVTSPNGGEVWAAGSVHTISWSATNIALAHVEYRRTPGDPWQLLADVPGYYGNYSWTLPFDATSQAKVRVRDAWDSAPQDSSNQAFTIALPLVAESPSPLDFETWPTGVSRLLAVTLHNTGTAALSVSSISAATLLYKPGRTSLGLAPGASDTVGVTFFTNTAGTYSDTLVITSNAYNQGTLRVPMHAQATDQPIVVLEAPNGGEAWQYGTMHSITWGSAHLGLLTIEYQSQSAGAWNLIAQHVASASRSYAWTVPYDLSTAARVRVREEGGTHADSSASVFSLTAPLYASDRDTVRFLLTLVGVPVTETVHLRNPGTAPLSISNISSNNSHFYTGRTSFVIPAAGSDTLSVSFRPVAAGNDSALITLTTDDPFSPHTIKAIGKATANTAVGDQQPQAIALWQNRPNPFSRSTEIRYTLPVRVHVRLDVFNVRGERVATLVREDEEPGLHSVHFGSRVATSEGRTRDLPSGVYFYRFTAGGFASTHKMLMMR